MIVKSLVIALYGFTTMVSEINCDAQGLSETQYDFINTEDVWARRSFSAASLSLELACYVSWCGFRVVAPFGKFDCKTNMIHEIALRSFYFFQAVLLSIPSLPLAGISQLFRCAGWLLQSRGYTHVRGNENVAEKTFSANESVKIMTFNVAAIPAGISYKVAGVPHWQSRIEGIVAKIKAADPDVLVIQEAYDTAFQEEIVCRLKDLFPHFFLHLGVGFLGGLGPGGVMMATKGAVSHFSDHPFKNNPLTQCRRLWFSGTFGSTRRTAFCSIHWYPSFLERRGSKRKKRTIQANAGIYSRAR